MDTASARPPAWPFFLPASAGARFCLYHAALTGECRGALVLVHAFAEEMNRSRRMFAQLSRALADAGVAVLTIDLYGCGDSAGDFGDARWDIWRDDLVLAGRWLQQQTGQPVGFLGLRLGALLALEAAAARDGPVGPVILWQPVLRGEPYVTQFLRLRQAAAMVTGQATDASEAPASGASKSLASDGDGHGSAALRKQLLDGRGVEVSGYLLAPELAAAIDAVDLASLALPNASLHWFDVAADSEASLPLARQRGAGMLRQRGAWLEISVVQGPAFWASQEITEAPALVAATVALFREGGACLA